MPKPTANHRHPALRPRTLAVALAACGITPLAIAQAVETVVITATKRTGWIQDTPIAVSALSGTQLDDAGIKSSLNRPALRGGLLA